MAFSSHEEYFATLGPEARSRLASIQNTVSTRTNDLVTVGTCCRSKPQFARVWSFSHPYARSVS